MCIFYPSAQNTISSKGPAKNNLCFSLSRWSSVSPLSLGVIHIVSVPSICLCCLATCPLLYIPLESISVRSMPWKDPAFLNRLTPAPVSSCLRMQYSPGTACVTRVNLCIKCTEQQEVLAAMRNEFCTQTEYFSHLHLHIFSKLTHISHTQLIGQASRHHELHFTGFSLAHSVGVGWGESQKLRWQRRQKSTERATIDNPQCLALITRLFKHGAGVRMY